MTQRTVAAPSSGIIFHEVWSRSVLLDTRGRHGDHGTFLQLMKAATGTVVNFGTRPSRICGTYTGR